jgi:hypothetical protein
MANGGANMWALTDRHCLYFYIPHESSITQAGGTGMPSKAWGGVLVQFGSNVYLVAPVYHCPQNPRNTYSPGVLIDFCHFQCVVIDTHCLIDMQDNDGHRHQLPISTHNNLDYVDITILTLRPISIPTGDLTMTTHPNSAVNPTICSQTILPRRSPRLLAKQCPPALPATKPVAAPCPISPTSSHTIVPIINPRLEKTQQFIVPKEALMTIIHFYVNLHPAPSPRSIAI